MDKPADIHDDASFWLTCLQDGNSNWLKGVLLLVTYVLVAAGFWMHKDTDLSQEDVDAAHRHHLL
jgi:hypothetical protein